MKNENILKIHQVIFPILFISYLFVSLLFDMNPVLSSIWITSIALLIGIRLYLKPSIKINKSRFIVLIIALLGMLYIALF